MSVTAENQQLAEQIAQLLIERQETVTIAESTTGGLISAPLLAVAGASAYYLGGSIIYTGASRKAFLDLDLNWIKTLKPLSEDMVLAFASAAREKLNASWGVAELGAAGPADSPYGHPAGSCVIGVSGPAQASIEIRTGSNNRAENMGQFATTALGLLLETLRST